MEEQIIQNAIKILEDPKNPVYLKSSHRHDFVSFKFKDDKSISLDGGHAYVRRVGDFDAPFEELVLTNKEPIEKVRADLIWGSRGKNGDEPLKYQPIKDLTLSHLKAIIKNCSNIASPHKEVIEYWIKQKSKKS